MSLKCREGTCLATFFKEFERAVRSYKAAGGALDDIEIIVQYKAQLVKTKLLCRSISKKESNVIAVINMDTNQINVVQRKRFSNQKNLIMQVVIIKDQASPNRLQ